MNIRYTDDSVHPNTLVGFTGIAFNTHGAKTWYVNGKPHRDDGPALEIDIKSKDIKSDYWFKDGELHRSDGPAWTHSDGSSRYYINGDEVTKESQELFRVMELLALSKKSQ